jgi:hypothetical protein
VIDVVALCFVCSLNSNRRSELKATQRARLAKELEETRAKLAVLTEQHAAVASAKAAIQRKRARISQTALGYGKLLNYHNDQLKAKIQEFEDQGMCAPANRHATPCRTAALRFAVCER